MNEFNVIDELKNRNKDGIKYILDSYGKLIYSVAFMELKSKELSEECLNDVMLKVWNNIDSYNYEKSQFKNWILTITKYTAIDILRKEKRHFNINNETLVEGKEKNVLNGSFEEEYLSKEELLKVQAIINQFSEIDKIIFIERFFVGKSIGEIATELGMTQNSISLRINKGRKKIRKMIKEDCDNEY